MSDLPVMSMPERRSVVRTSADYGRTGDPDASK
jgi:hypothetical protein